MEIEAKNESDDLTIVTLTGRLDVMGTQDIDMKFTTLAATRRTGLVVDMSAVDFVASIGIRLLLSNAKALSSRGGKLVLSSPTPLVKDVLVTAGIDQLIPVFDDVDSAIAAVALD